MNFGKSIKPTLWDVGCKQVKNLNQHMMQFAGCQNKNKRGTLHDQSGKATITNSSLDNLVNSKLSVLYI